MSKRGIGVTYQVPPPEFDFPLLEPEPGVDVGSAPPAGCFTFAQKLVYQFRIVLISPGLAVQALSHTPAVPWLKGTRRESAQKQASYTDAAAAVFAGGTQAPFTSKRGPQLLTQAGKVAVLKSVVWAEVVG